LYIIDFNNFMKTFDILISPEPNHPIPSKDVKLNALTYLIYGVSPKPMHKKVRH
jgi:hypothetical protein